MNYHSVIASLFVVAFVICISSARQHDDDEDISWSYTGINGTECWCEIAPTCCGKSQSPIDLNFVQAGFIETEVFVFSRYNLTKNAGYVLENDGRNVILRMWLGPKKPKKVANPSVKGATHVGGGLDSTYIFEFAVFHWSSVSTQGSEHSFFMLSFPLEVQLIHRQKKYRTLNQALKSKDPQAVSILSIIFALWPEDNLKLDRLISSVSQIKYRNRSVDLDRGFMLEDLFPECSNIFYRYEGSMTVPRCLESVTWTVFTTPNYISEYQLMSFRSLRSTGEDEFPQVRITRNFRPVQSRHERKVWKVFAILSPPKQKTGASNDTKEKTDPTKDGTDEVETDEKDSKDSIKDNWDLRFDGHSETSTHNETWWNWLMDTLFELLFNWRRQDMA